MARLKISQCVMGESRHPRSHHHWTYTRGEIRKNYTLKNYSTKDSVCSIGFNIIIETRLTYVHSCATPLKGLAMIFSGQEHKSFSEARTIKKKKKKKKQRNPHNKIAEIIQDFWQVFFLGGTLSSVF